MRAYRLFQWKKGGKLVDNIPIPEPAPCEVLIKVAGNGICQSDVHFMYEWEQSPPHLNIKLPMTIGHELGGWIEKIGNGVERLEIGMPCIVTIYGCGKCWYCVTGWNNYCPYKPPQPGMGRDGGLADYVVVNADGVIPIKDLDPYIAAPITDAGLSSYHAIKRVENLLYPDANIVVIGVGGLGHMAVMLIKELFKVNLIALDISKKALKLAKELKADYILEFNKNSINEINKIVKSKGVQAVIDFVGNGNTISLAAEILAPLGHIVVVGRGKGGFQFKDRAIPYGSFISTTFGGSKSELLELVNLLELGIIKPIISKFRLNEVDNAFKKLINGEISGRAVVVP